MRKILLIMSCVLAITTSAQKVNWLMADGGKSMERVWDIAVTAQNSVLICGQYNDTLLVEGVEYLNEGGSDVFIAMYSEEGLLEWVTTIGGNGEDVALSIDSGGDGNSYLTGYFTNQMVLLGDTLVADGWDIYVVKIDSDGVVERYARPRCLGSELGYGIDVNELGDIFITGWFQNELDFGNNQKTTSFGGSDVFVAKYNTNLEIQWAKHAGNVGVEYGYKVAADAVGNCYVTGVAAAGSNFGDMMLDSGNVFIAKYNELGSVVALNYHTGDGVNDISVNSRGFGHIGGRISGLARFYGEHQFLMESFAGTDDAYVAAFDENLQWQWGVVGSGQGSNKGRAVYTDEDDNVFFTGTYQNEFVFGAFSNGSPDNNDAVFISQIDPEGDVKWLKQSIGEGADVATAIAFNQNNLFVTGWYTDYISFDGFAATNSGVDYYLLAFDFKVGFADSYPSTVPLNVYPNPVRDLLTVEGIPSGEMVFVSITDMSGSVWQIQQALATESSIQLHIANFPIGTYIIEIQSMEVCKTVSFIKSHY